MLISVEQPVRVHHQTMSSSWLLLDLTVLALLGTASALCFDGCYHTSDGFCDDGGPGSEYSDCALGHDCTDCGDSERAPSPPAPCVDACFYGRVAVAMGRATTVAPVRRPRPATRATTAPTAPARL